MKCGGKGIPLTAYSPLGRGKAAESDVLMTLADAHNASPAQVALAFLLFEGFIVIPSSKKPERIASNFAAKDIVLTERDIASIRDLDAGLRLVDGPWCPAWDTS